jgi:hypothetical protein
MVLSVLGLEQLFSLPWFIFVAGIRMDMCAQLAPFSQLGSGRHNEPPSPVEPSILLPSLFLLSYILPFVPSAAIPASPCAYRCRKSWN